MFKNMSDHVGYVYAPPCFLLSKESLYRVLSYCSNKTRKIDAFSEIWLKKEKKSTMT